ncbi:MAG: hypothetical protein ABR504_03885 [Paracoccaceae bacterium]
MTRIFYWNINQFSSANLVNYRTVTARNRGKRQRIPDTQMRDLIHRHFAQFGFGAVADIIVIVEVSTGTPNNDAPRCPARSNTNWGDDGHIRRASDHLAMVVDI